MAEISQHDIEIQENRAHWERKPVLRRVYRAFHAAIARWALSTQQGVTLELGSGMGPHQGHPPRLPHLRPLSQSLARPRGKTPTRSTGPTTRWKT